MDMLRIWGPSALGANSAVHPGMQRSPIYSAWEERSAQLGGPWRDGRACRRRRVLAALDHPYI